MNRLFDVEEAQRGVKSNVLFSSEMNNWHTPSVYAEAAREVMGSLELDPASCEEANKVIGAKRYYTEEQNGLLQDWTCSSMFINPPYGLTNNKSNQGIWTKRLIEEYHRGVVKQAILLVNAKTDTRWFEMLWDFALCFTRGRINYYTTKMYVTVGNTNGSCFVYLGPNIKTFVDVFTQFGPVITPDGVHRREKTAQQASLWDLREEVETIPNI